MAQLPILYVESDNDSHVCYALCAYYDIPEVFTIQAKNGLNNLLKVVDLELKKKDDDRPTVLGILIDADDNPAQRWREVMRQLKRRGYQNLPDQADPMGSIIVEQDRPVVGIWLMPDNQHPGELEDFVAQMVPEGDQLWEQANTTLQQLVEQRFRDQDRSKAQMHTWLAWQQESGRPMGYSIGRRVLNPDTPLARHLAEWLRRVFVGDAQGRDAE